MKKLHIYHINDLHSHFENWPKIRRFLLEKKAFHEMNGEEVLLFDIGDACDQGAPFNGGHQRQSKHRIVEPGSLRRRDNRQQ
jgi:2',3'-cyclic-nucleotide 2'-phosphodiesterase (5'-nucleotidase family)